MDALKPGEVEPKSARAAILGTILAQTVEELSRPLDQIVDHAQKCLKSKLVSLWPPVLIESLEAIQLQALRGRHRIRNISHFAELEARDIQPVRINGVVSEVVLMMEPELRQCGVVARMELSDELPMIWGDVSHLRHALANLVENAADAMKNTDPTRREIVLATRFTSEGVLIEVRDNGCEFAPEIRERLFEPFVTTKTNGMGLGLAVVRRIVTTHGGTLTATPRKSGGMSIRMALPIVNPQARSASANEIVM